MKKRCLAKQGIVLLLLIILQLTLIDIVFSDSIEIKNFGQIGFSDTDQEYTSLRTVTLEINYTQNSSCRFSNDNITWTHFELCTSQKYWLLNESVGQKTVFAEFNLTNGSIYIINDTIYYNFTGAGLDTSAPSGVTITNDLFSNNNNTVSFSWSTANDAESDLLKIPLVYSYRILINNLANNSWTFIGTDRNVTYIVNLTHNDNVTILVNATNSAGLNSQSNSTITIDLIPPNNTQVSSDRNESQWYSYSSVFFNWSSSDELSDIFGYSYTLSTQDSITPDNVPEGEDDLQNHINETFFGLTTGMYIFKIKAIDNAGNFGNITSYNVSIDATLPFKPTLLSSEKIFGTSIINYTWSESYDEDSGLDYFTIEIWNSTSYNYSTNDLQNTTNLSVSTLNYEFTPVVNFTNFYARVRAVDDAGNPSIWSSGESEYDTTAPTISVITPRGDTEGNPPVIRLTTNERANCYIDNSGSLILFEYTNSTYHETKSNVYDIKCYDLAGNEAPITIPGFNNPSSPATFNNPIVLSTAYTGQITYANLSLDHGGVEKNRFKAYLDGSEIDFTINDIGDGDYVLGFMTPKEEGSPVLNVEVDSILSDDATLTVLPLTLDATYEGDFSNIDDDRFTYFNEGDYSAGFATDSTTHSFGSGEDILGMSALYDGKIYFFATKGIDGIKTKNNELKEKTFLSQKRPSFGYSQSSYNTLTARVKYSNIRINGDETLGIGGHNLIVKRIKDANVKTVFVTSQISNYNEKGVVQYD